MRIGLGAGLGVVPLAIREPGAAPPAIDPTESSAVLSDTETVQGVPLTLTVTLRDAGSAPLAGRAVSAIATPSTGISIGNQGATNGAGVRVLTVTGASVGSFALQVFGGAVELDDAPTFDVTPSSPPAGSMYAANMYAANMYAAGMNR